MKNLLLMGCLLVAPSVAQGGSRAYLGVELLSVTPELREYFGGTESAGILVARVAEDGPAAKAGIQVGDLLVGIDGKNTISFGDVISRVLEKKKGDEISVEVIRKGKTQSYTVELGERQGSQMIHIGPGTSYWGGGIIDGKRLRDQIEEITRRVGSGQADVIRIPRGNSAELEKRLKILEEKLRKLESRAGEDT
ncbi:MAG: PDZ domain-containing protein [Myxococcota bacterium]